MKHFKKLFFMLLCCALGQAAYAQLELKPAAFTLLPGWSHAQLSSSLSAFQKSCTLLVKKAQPPFTSKAWASLCQQAQAVPADNEQAAKAFFTANFTPKLITADGLALGLFTGYYTPEVEGSLTKQGPYQVPVYGRPKDLQQRSMAGQVEYGQVVQGHWQPYATRAQIDAGALADKSPVILWLKSNSDRFFLQVQGSGVVQLNNGNTVQLAFDGKNGQPYTPIGKILLQAGQLQPGQVSMQTIKAWLTAHPKQADELMEKNASFVFFKLVPAPKHLNPSGAAGVALTPACSLAVDKQYIPLGLPLWLATEVKKDDKTKPFTALMVAQDTGSAIKGPIRGDVFWGVGESAAKLAGPMQSTGQYWALMPISP